MYLWMNSEVSNISDSKISICRSHVAPNLPPATCPVDEVYSSEQQKCYYFGVFGCLNKLPLLCYCMVRNFNKYSRKWLQMIDTKNRPQQTHLEADYLTLVWPCCVHASKWLTGQWTWMGLTGFLCPIQPIKLCWINWGYRMLNTEFQVWYFTIRMRLIKICIQKIGQNEILNKFAFKKYFKWFVEAQLFKTISHFIDCQLFSVACKIAQHCPSPYVLSVHYQLILLPHYLSAILSWLGHSHFLWCTGEHSFRN